MIDADTAEIIACQKLQMDRQTDGFSALCSRYAYALSLICNLYLTTYLFIYLPIHLSIYLSICLSIYLSIYLYIYAIFILKIVSKYLPVGQDSTIVLSREFPKLCHFQGSPRLPAPLVSPRHPGNLALAVGQGTSLKMNSKIVGKEGGCLTNR